MAFNSINRNVHAVISYETESGAKYIFKAIKSITIKESIAPNDRFQFGTFCKNSIELSYYTSMLDEAITWANKKISVYFYEADTEDYLSAKDSWVQCGVFWIDTTKTVTSDNGISYTVTGYNMPTFLTEEVPTDIGTNVQTIITNICKQSGLVFEESTPQTDITLETIDSVPEGTTYAGLLGYFAGYEARCLRVNHRGKLELYGNLHGGWLTPTETLTPDELLHPGHIHYTLDTLAKLKVTRSEQYQGELKNGGQIPPINAIITGTSENVITVGSGDAMEFENPYITQEHVEYVFHAVKGLLYNIGTVRWRGNPIIEAGDVIKVETNNNIFVLFYVHEQEIDYDGGLSFTSTSYTYFNDTTVIGGTSPTQKKLEKIYTGLNAAYEKATEVARLYETGGYYQVLAENENSYPYGWRIADSETITSSTRGWKFTQAGMTYSEDGFQTVSKVAILMDGSINADCVTTGMIKSGDGSSYWNLDTGEIVIKGYLTDAKLEMYVTKEEATNNVISWINASADNIILNTKKLIFGVYPDGQYIEVSNYYEDEVATGVLFDGTGKIEFTPSGEYRVENIVDDVLQNQFIMAHTDKNYLVLKNCTNSGNRGNDLFMFMDSRFNSTHTSSNYVQLSNAQKDSEEGNVANWLSMISDATTSRNRMYFINRTYNNKSANAIYFDATLDTKNSITIQNHDINNPSYYSNLWQMISYPASTEFNLYNYFDKTLTNSFKMAHGTSMNTMIFENRYFSFEGDTANSIQLSASSSSNGITLANKKYDVAIVANQILTGSNSSNNYLHLENYSMPSTSSSVLANRVQLTSLSSYNSLEMINKFSNSSTNANRWYMSSSSDTGGSYILNNDANGVAANEIRANITNSYRQVLIGNYKSSSTWANYIACTYSSSSQSIDINNVVSTGTNRVSLSSSSGITIANSLSCKLTMDNSQNVLLSAPNSMTIESTNYNVYLKASGHIYANGKQID